MSVAKRVTEFLNSTSRVCPATFMTTSILRAVSVDAVKLKLHNLGGTALGEKATKKQIAEAIKAECENPRRKRGVEKDTNEAKKEESQNTTR